VTPRPVDRALFLAGESTLTVAEVTRWAAELGYPVADVPLEPSRQLVVARADESEGWRRQHTEEGERT
jgi:hypothetical protein